MFLAPGYGELRSPKAAIFTNCAVSHLLTIRKPFRKITFENKFSTRIKNTVNPTQVKHFFCFLAKHS
jgi:hypothetical protein